MCASKITSKRKNNRTIARTFFYKSVLYKRLNPQKVHTEELFNLFGSYYLFCIFCKFSNQDQTLVCHSKLIIKCKTIENNIIKLYIFWKLNKLSNKIWKKINKCCHGDLRVFKYFQNGSKSCEKYRNFNFELNYLDQIQP